MRLATGVNSLKVRLPHLADWLAKAQPDIVCLQELKLEDAKFPRAELEAAGYQAAVSGQKTYNGVAVLARTGLSDVGMGMPGFADEQKRVIAATVGGVRAICVYCPNGQRWAAKSPYKLRWLRREGVRGCRNGRHPRLALAAISTWRRRTRTCNDPKAGSKCTFGARALRRRALLDWASRNVPLSRAAREDLGLVGLPDAGIPPPAGCASTRSCSAPLASAALCKVDKEPRSSSGPLTSAGLQVHGRKIRPRLAHSYVRCRTELRADDPMLGRNRFGSSDN